MRSSTAVTARALVSATGPWHEPKIPLDASVFQGEIFHSARWQDFSGRRVAVVGTGASAVQFVPEIQSRVDQLSLFQRTAPWVLPKPSLKLPRPVVFGSLELFSFGFRHPAVMKVVQRIGLLHLRRAIRSPELRAALTPGFVLGCKRLLMSNTYYPALAQPNVSVVPHAVREFTADGIVGADGRNSTMWPWSTVRMMRRIRSFDPADYDISSVTGTDNPAVEPSARA